MAFDEALAARLRNGLGALQGVSETRMMGGLCVLVNGNMLAGVHRTKDGRDGIMFRVGKDSQAEALRRHGATPVELGGRRMGGFVFLDAAACNDAVLRSWIDLALGFVRTLPPKNST